MGKPTLAIYGIKDRHSYNYPGYTHDHNLCLMQDGKILQYLHLERYTRRKYDNRLDLFLEELIDNKQLELPDDFDLVNVNSFVGNAFISANGRVRFEASIQPKLSTDLEKGTAFFQSQLWEGKELNAYNCPHELAHIASCLPFFGEFKENSLLISFDGGSSLSNFSAFHFKNNKIELIESHWDLGYLSKFFNDNALNFQILGAKSGEHCSVPGKLMGYASYGHYDKRIENWLIENNYFRTYWKNADAILQSAKNTFGITITNFDNGIQFFQNVVATFQFIFEREVINKIEQLQIQTKADYLYYAGGCALNIVTNSKIIDKQIFKDVFIPPCCNDSGLSIGAAAFLEWKKGNTIQIHSPYLCNVGLENCKYEPISDELIKETAEIILKGGIVGISNGNGEVGPRALGNRSLIALANSKELATKLSMEVKKREWYRPVAPIMLREVAEKVTEDPIHHLSKFMLLDFTIKPDFVKDLEGVIHANNTARIQVLYSESENPFMYKLLQYLYQKYKISALINTSFNIQGEPIIQTESDAILSAKKMNLNGLVINHQYYTL
jgi:carbamoyltransferase